MSNSLANLLIINFSVAPESVVEPQRHIHCSINDGMNM